VIGSFNDAQLRDEIAQLDCGRIQLVDYRPVSEVPRLLMIGDLVCLPQDATTEFVSYQTPMKLTEALAMGLPVLGRETPSLTPFARRGQIETIGDAPLSERISEMFADPGTVRDTARRGREFFLEHLSYTVALESVNHVIAGLPRNRTEVPPSWERACELASSFGGIR
jgi:glycosyltransferase involved in cell wall biosynthesis